VEDVEVTGVQQQSLGGNQGFASNLEGRRLSGVAGICRSGVLQFVIPGALYPLVLQLYHCCSSDYIITLKECSALVDPILSFLSGSSR
jgi:hypothetical protein